MLYNQPYDQPTNPNAPYVDGNPAAGIQGSIVPAAGVEFDQREIVEVIQQAYNRKYSDFTSTPCAAPGNTDLTQLRKAIEGFIRTTPVPQWYIDNPVTWQVHGTGAKYTDLNAAFEDLSKYIITHNGSVTLTIPAGRWTYTTGVILDHPNADRITVTGANLLSYPVPSDFAVTGYSATARANDRVNTLNRLRTRFATEIDFNGGGGMSASCTGLTLQNFMVVGDRASGGTIALDAGILFISNISICNSYSSGFAIAGGQLSLLNGSFCSASGCVGHGIAAAMGGDMWHGSNTNIWVTSNDQNGIGAGFDCGANGYAMITAAGNAGAGLMCSIIGQFQTGPNSQFNMNATCGVFVDQGCFYTDINSQFNNNGGSGLYVTVGSSGQCANPASFSGNVGTAVTAFAGSYVYVPGATGVAGHSSPAVNTLSADGSYVSN